ncbi:MAG: hypothetical protein RI980_197 [Bacteroidota bacterium]|jgi:hypothetical protein
MILKTLNFPSYSILSLKGLALYFQHQNIFRLNFLKTMVQFMQQFNIRL